LLSGNSAGAEIIAPLVPGAALIAHHK